MPTLTTIQIPKPDSWSDFERIAQSSLKIRWKSPNLSRHGRSGQAQSGIDFYGPDDLQRLVGVQCKKATDLTKIVIEREIAKAEKFKPSLAAFYFATTADSDSSIQQIVRTISAARVTKNKFPAGIFFWQDLMEDLVKNEEEFKAHYPQLANLQAGGAAAGSRFLAALELSYHGLSLSLTMELLFGEPGQFAQEDPLQLSGVLRILENCAVVLMDPVNSSQLCADTKALEATVFTHVAGDSDTFEKQESTRRLVKRIEDRIRAYEVHLQNEELCLFAIGKLLGKLSHVLLSSDEIPSEFSKRLKELIGELSFDPKLPKTFREILKRYRDNKSVAIIRAAHDIFNAVRASVINLQIKW